MDYQKLVQLLPNHYENWGQEQVQLQSIQFQQVKAQIQGETAANVMQLLNSTIGCMAADEIYCELGTVESSTLIAALLGHPGCMAYAVGDLDVEYVDKLAEQLQQFQQYSDIFHHIPHNLKAVCQQIIEDQLHILVYPEIGMDPPTLQMAALRLAPIQCTAWGHPVTTGLSTIDYFLSSELMETENAQSHYSETLIKLPNIGVAYPKPQDIPVLTKKRSDFQLLEDDVLYLCCQAPFKYLPQYDYILPEIALQVPDAKFLFLRGELLKLRLERAFADVGLNHQNYCIHLKIPARQDYLMLNLLCDAFLDTFTWSGGNTSLEAIACNLPIITCPGEFMRGRHADSFLKLLGVTDTIAQTEAEYIDIAVRLGNDSEWKHSIFERMSQRHHHLFDDQSCVRALESFYEKVTQEHRN